MKYLVEIQGGQGPDVWVEEKTIDGADFIDCAKQADGWAEDSHGTITSMSLSEI